MLVNRISNAQNHFKRVILMKDPNGGSRLFMESLLFVSKNESDCLSSPIIPLKPVAETLEMNGVLSVN